MDVTPIRLAAIVAAALALTAAPPAVAAGGSYVFAGGTTAEQGQVRRALDASSFDFGRLPQRITVHIGRGTVSSATPGDVYLDAGLLDAGRFAWGVVQHEFAHQVDFFLLDDPDREQLRAQFGVASWWAGATHAQVGCERFASNFAWAFWPVAANVMRPRSVQDEAGSIGPAAFRAELYALLAT